MHISEVLKQAERDRKPVFSFEYFPPKTDQGVQNLYDRMDRMHDLGPAFIDITWGAGGRTATLTSEMVSVAQGVYGLETCMHLTCTDMHISMVDDALRDAYNSGCTNILALRGDPPREKEKWQAIDGGFSYAKDLVHYIRKKYGNHFDIGVAGYPEGCDDNKDPISLMQHLKEKIDAGATFIVTQMCYDLDAFLDWVRRTREAGIDVPIVPGIMPIQTHAAFLRRAHNNDCRIPPSWLEAMEPIKNDDAEVRKVGTALVADLCRKILEANIWSLHFYTMNLAQATRMTLEELGLISSDSTIQKTLPWRQSKGRNRRDEDVRPIFWKHRNKSYVTRTQDWDEFPNGRWGDARSPAFGQLDNYNLGLKGSNEQNIKLWGKPTSLREVADIFVGFLEGKYAKLPWSDGGLTSEVDKIKAALIDLNRRGFLTINSQPAVNGVKSSDPIHGWGPHGGYCYQKAYLEFLMPPSLLETLIKRIKVNSNTTFHAVNQAGELHTNAPSDGPNAVTWGVFPSQEIVQPTIVETISFLAWKDEAFRLGTDWARCHPASSPTRQILGSIMQEWYLVNIVDNDFHSSDGIFKLFEGLEVPNLDEKMSAQTNDVEVHDPVNGTSKPETNGLSKKEVNGISGPVVNGVTKHEVNGAATHEANGASEANGVKLEA